MMGSPWRETLWRRPPLRHPGSRPSRGACRNHRRQGLEYDPRRSPIALESSWARGRPRTSETMRVHVPLRTFPLLLSTLVCPLASPSDAAVFSVDSLIDASDSAHGDGVCASALAGAPCTLRAAVQEANALAGADRIELPAGIPGAHRGGHRRRARGDRRSRPARSARDRGHRGDHDRSRRRRARPALRSAADGGAALPHAPPSDAARRSHDDSGATRGLSAQCGLGRGRSLSRHLHRLPLRRRRRHRQRRRGARRRSHLRRQHGPARRRGLGDRRRDTQRRTGLVARFPPRRLHRQPRGERRRHPHYGLVLHPAARDDPHRRIRASPTTTRSRSAARCSATRRPISPSSTRPSPATAPASAARSATTAAASSPCTTAR